MFRHWVNVCSGKMSLKEVYLEMFHYFHHKNLSRLVIDIQRKEDGFYTKIWMSDNETLLVTKDWERRTK